VNAYNDLDKVMLNHYGMTAANGIYSLAYRVVNLFTVPITAIYMAAVPTFFSYGVSGCERSIALTRRLLRKSTAVGIASALCMFVAAPILPHILGSGYLPSVSAVRWLALIPLFRSFQWSAADVLTGMDRQRLRMGLQTGAVAFNLILNFILIPRYSWVGAAIASLATDGLLGAVMWMALHRVRSIVRRNGAQMDAQLYS
jgi:O-antigen/teichoic acid export membrane protein